MFRWALKTSDSNRRGPSWTVLGLLALSPVLFLSGVFLLFAPLPILFLYYRVGFVAALAAILLGLVAVFSAGGLGNLVSYGILVVSICVGLPYFLKRAKTLDGVVAGTLMLVVLAGMACVISYSKSVGNSAVPVISTFLNSELDQFLGNLPEPSRTVVLENTNATDWKKAVIPEIPWKVGVFILLMVWLNVMMIMRINPDQACDRMGLGPNYYKTWKVPELILWPSMVGALLYVLLPGTPSLIGLNLIMFFGAVYTLHGLSILLFLLDAWKVRGLARSAGILVAVFAALPLLAGVGFFDQWFDFRGKLRQT